MRTHRILLSVILVVLLSACGGGGSSPPAPVAQTPAPTVTVSSLFETVTAGQVFFIDATAVVDGQLENDVDLSCSGGLVAIGELDDSRVQIAVPLPTSLTTAECVASVRDSSGRTASGTLPFTILPFSAIGKVVGVFDPSIELLLPNAFVVGSGPGLFSQHFTALREEPGLSGRQEVRGIGGNTDFSYPKQYFRDDIITFEGQYFNIEFIQSPSLSTHGLSDNSISIVSAEENKVYWLAQDFETRALSVKEELDIERPCYIAETTFLFGNDLVIGQKNFGLSVYDLIRNDQFAGSERFDVTLVNSVTDGRSLCHIMRGILPLSLDLEFPNASMADDQSPPYAAPLVAIDYNTNEFVFYGDGAGDGTIVELGNFPIETNSSVPLEIIQVFQRGSSSTIPTYFLILMSDGNHIGNHRLIQVNLDTDSREFSQEIIHAWSEGVPVSMVQGPMGGSMDGGNLQPDLAVVLGTSEQSFFFDNMRPFDIGDISKPPVYETPVLFEVGLGAGSAVFSERPDEPVEGEPDQGMLVSYPDTGHVIYISLGDLQ